MCAASARQQSVGIRVASLCVLFFAGSSWCLAPASQQLRLSSCVAGTISMSGWCGKGFKASVVLSFMLSKGAYARQLTSLEEERLVTCGKK